MKWQFEYCRAIELARNPGDTNGARDLGSLVHRLMEALYTNEDWRAVLRAEVNARVEAGTFSPEWATHYRYAEVMMDGYIDWVKSEHLDIDEEILHAEPQLEVDLGTFHGDVVLLTGKPDLIKRNTTNDTLIIEDHKTVGKLSTVMLHAPQGNSYALLAKAALGLDVTMFRTNQLKKVLRTAKASPPFYGRSEKFISKEELSRHYYMLRGQLDDMVRLMQYWEYKRDSEIEEFLQRFYTSPGIQCNGCDFVAPCTTLIEGADHEYVIRNFYRPKPINDFDGVEGEISE